MSLIVLAENSLSWVNVQGTSKVLAVHSPNQNPFSLNPGPGPDSETACNMKWYQMLFLPYSLLELKLNTFVMVSVKIN